MKTEVNVFNKTHFEVDLEGFSFSPGEEIWIEIETNSMRFRTIRADKRLRVGRIDNEVWNKRNYEETYAFNMVYDAGMLARSFAYPKVIEALATPIIKYLPEGSAGFTNFPARTGLNLRFFSERRIHEQGKHPVGPKDVFMSHGIGDKEYWNAEMIKGFSNVLVPGPAWKEKIEKGGYKGRIFVTGYTKLDPLFNGGYKRNKYSKPYIVWAPTHGYYKTHKGRSSYPECLQLIKEIPNIYEKKIALHPANKIRHSRSKDVTLQELLDADVVIADAGSTLYEAWALGKPVIFPDWLCKWDILDRFGPENLEYQIYSKGIGYHAENMKHLVELIEVALAEGMREPEKEFMERIFPTNLRGKAGEASAKALLQISEEGGE